MKERPKISDAEWIIMKVLWKQSPAAANEIITALKPHTHWSAKTIHTLISRLIKKEALEVEKAQPFYLYRPCISEEECRREETRSFMKKVYDGSLRMFVVNFLKQEKLSPEEIEELQNILNEKKE